MITLSGLGRVRGVDAGIGAHEAVVGDADQHPAGGAQDLSPTRRARPGHGAGPCRARPRAAVPRASGLDVGEPADAALGLRHDLVGDDDHVVAAQASGPAAAAISAARSSPACDLRDPLERDRGQHAAQLRLRSSWLSIPRVCAAPPWVAASVRRQLLEVLGGVDVERERGDVDDLARRIPAGCGAIGGGAGSCRARTPARARPAGSAAARSSPSRGGRGRSAPSARARAG